MDMFQVGKSRNPAIANEIFRVRNEGFMSFGEQCFFFISLPEMLFSTVEYVQDFSAQISVISHQMKSKALIV